MHNRTEPETAFVKDGIMPDPLSTTSPEFKRVLQLVKCSSPWVLPSGRGCEKPNTSVIKLEGMVTTSRHQREWLRDGDRIRQRVRLPSLALRRATSWGTQSILGGGPRCFMLMLRQPSHPLLKVGLARSPRAWPCPVCRVCPCRPRWCYRCSTRLRDHHGRCECCRVSFGKVLVTRTSILGGLASTLRVRTVTRR